MVDPPPYPDSDTGPDRESTTGAPRWVKVFGIITLVLILLLIVVLLRGGHGPRDHGGTGGQTPPSGVTSGDHKPPVGHSPSSVAEPAAPQP